ncbi:catechol 2,3-dioxygenase-like lactoylglutathione lyase family enzyme [Mucilaginibacter frigoritolerans]|uniref:Catechol 2,3-dioxygenase-like lactoylglutathione lyase family enzyme n=1 Tax=Mucilaginibacter frigoritolerans TaxID=652788 RepID=A0A562UFL2_9SPHI|nr:VOC family protein [Mucilaginibacter frigoritolerans]TWJ04533.1 catechol 2,3-dioxygenase-like lactoylglutathione lyase family enzyme [Mucilaginibacter frigoritolerans]
MQSKKTIFKTIRLSKFLFAGTFLLSLCFKANAQTNDLGLKVHHITLSVKNIDTMVYWYTHVLDLKLIRKSDESARIELDGFFIDMLQVKGSSRQPSQDLSTDDHMQAQGWRHLVFNTADFYKTYLLLKAKGVVFPQVIDEKNKTKIQGIFFKDPEGNVLEIRHIQQ